MSDAVIFLFGCLVTALCIVGVAVLLWGGTQTHNSSPDSQQHPGEE